MTSETAIGVDVGTTRVKAVLADRTGTELHVAAVPTPWTTGPGGAQCDPAAIGDAALDVVAQVGAWAGQNGHRVRAVAVTGLAETGALIDTDGLTVAASYAWHNSLGDPARVIGALGADRFITTTGRRCTPVASIVKLDHLRHTGHVFAPDQRFLNIPDYVAYRLCGVMAAEASTSSRSGLVDVLGRRWWPEAFDYLGADTHLVPDLVPASTRLGRVRVPLAGCADAIVVTGGHDHPTAGFAVGGQEAGCLNVSLGTAEAQLRITPLDLTLDQVRSLVAAGGTVDLHPFGDRLTVLAALPTGTTMERLSHLLGHPDPADRSGLSRRALAVEPAPGVRLTDMTMDSFGLGGLAEGLSPEGVWRAVAGQLVAASASLTRSVDAVLGPADRVVTFGGWLHDPLVADLRAGLGQRLGPHCPAEPGAVGAALLAFAGLQD